MSNFDPEPNAPYGRCLTCDATFDTKDAANEHMNKTLDEAKARGESPRSHSTRATNPDRKSRIRSSVSMVIDDAIEEAMSELDRILDRGGITEAEIMNALRSWPDFHDAREDWTADEVSA